MLLIIAHHYVVNSGLLAPNGPISTNLVSVKSLFLLSVGAFGKSGINCFMMITGYSDFSCVTLVRMIIPIRSVGTNFIECYLLFFLCIPFLNKLLQSLNEKQHIALILLSSFIYIFYETIPVFAVSINYVSWFSVMYCLASYARLYPKKVFSKRNLWLALSLITSLLSVASVIVCTYLSTRSSLFWPYSFVSEANNFLAVAVGFCTFMLFKNISVRNSRFINGIASTTFGVLCIHANSTTMRSWLWGDFLNNCKAYYENWWAVHFLGSTILVFVVCSAIEYLRLQLIEGPVLKLWDRCSAGMLLRVKNRINKQKSGCKQAGK